MYIYRISTEYLTKKKYIYMFYPSFMNNIYKTAFQQTYICAILVY